MRSIDGIIDEQDDMTYLTCSEIKSVSPTASTHLPKNCSPKNGFRGFFSLPYLSDLEAYCCLRVDRNHLRTSRQRFSGSCSLAGATKMAGCSAQ